MLSVREVPLISWERVVPELQDDVFLPRSLSLLAPRFWAEGYLELVYDRSWVIYMLTHNYPETPIGQDLRRIITEAINSIR